MGSICMRPKKTDSTKVEQIGPEQKIQKPLSKSTAQFKPQQPIIQQPPVLTNNKSSKDSQHVSISKNQPQKNQKAEPKKQLSSVESIFKHLTKANKQHFEGNQQMTDQQLFAFLSDYLKISDDDTVTGFILVEVINLEKIQLITFDKFKRIFGHCGAKNTQQIIDKLPSMRQKMLDKNIHTKVYKKIFDIYSGSKTTLDMEVAELLWGVYLKGILIWYKEFMDYVGNQEGKENIKVHRYLWEMMIQFSYDVKELSHYSENDGWPIFIDNFIQEIKNKQVGN